MNAADTVAEVVLGANDKHLLFRSCVRIQMVGPSCNVMLGTRVHCKNLFGRFYMAAIDGGILTKLLSILFSLRSPASS